MLVNAEKIDDNNNLSLSSSFYYVSDIKLSLKDIIPNQIQMWKVNLIRYNFRAKVISY